MLSLTADADCLLDYYQKGRSKLLRIRFGSLLNAPKDCLSLSAHCYAQDQNRSRGFAQRSGC